MNRRRFLKSAVKGTAGALVGGAIYSCVEATWLRVVHDRITMPALPPSFRGFRIAFLTDLHHGPWTGLAYVRCAARMANELEADVVLLGGDYCHNAPEFIEPCIEALGDLRAAMGVYAVMGNHDHYQSSALTRGAFEKNKIRELKNDGVWLERNGERLRVAGVDDFWMGGPQLQPALDGMRADERCVLVSHNPDFVDQISDPRVGLMLSGHTHGGQIVFPLIGAPIVPSCHGSKYIQGLMRTPNNLLFISRGLGTVTPPLRFGCRPEINLIELV
ncbi:MAG TPA: metallophosphoesterase [Planctomycetota bacterium]|nr:metallophosphoesterase [Planctomycetota bacterium]